MRLVILHYHIFKNAGTTLEGILDHSFGERFAALDEPGLTEPMPDCDMIDVLRRRPELLAVSSHQIRHPVPEVPGFLFFDICFLRDPLDRLRSTYDYLRIRPVPGDPMSDLANRCELGDFVAAMVEQFPLYVRDVQVNLLACKGDSDEPTMADLEVATERMRATSFLGVVEAFDRSAVAGEYALRAAFPELDCARKAANVSREMAGGALKRGVPLQEICAPRVYEELVRLNALDFELLERARAEVERRFQEVPDAEARLRDLAERRAGRPPRVPRCTAASAGPRAAMPTSAAKAGAFTRVARLVKLLPYLPVLMGRGRKKLFDPDYYRRACPDAGATEWRALRHFLLRGGFAGCAPHPLFDPAFYLRCYPEVAAAGVNPLAHYLKHGAAQRLQPHPAFDAEFYLDRAPDVAAAGLNPLLHYLSHGAAEGRKPHALFQPDHYRKARGSAAEAGANPLIEFLEGKDGWCNPHRLFDCAAYLEAHPEAAGVNPLLHYLESRTGPAPRSAPEIDDVALSDEPHQRPFLRALGPDRGRRVTSDRGLLH